MVNNYQLGEEILNKILDGKSVCVANIYNFTDF